jgi:hypothetical protein
MKKITTTAKTLPLATFTPEFIENPVREGVVNIKNKTDKGRTIRIAIADALFIRRSSFFAMVR